MKNSSRYLVAVKNRRDVRRLAKARPTSVIDLSPEAGEELRHIASWPTRHFPGNQR